MAESMSSMLSNMDVYLDNLLTLFMIGSPFMPFSLFLPADCWFSSVLFDDTLTIPAICHTMVTGHCFLRFTVTVKKATPGKAWL